MEPGDRNNARLRAEQSFYYPNDERSAPVNTAIPGPVLRQRQPGGSTRVIRTGVRRVRFPMSRENTRTNGLNGVHQETNRGGRRNAVRAEAWPYPQRPTLPRLQDLSLDAYRHWSEARHPNYDEASYGETRSEQSSEEGYESSSDFRTNGRDGHSRRRTTSVSSNFANRNGSRAYMNGDHAYVNGDHAYMNGDRPYMDGSHAYMDGNNGPANGNGTRTQANGNGTRMRMNGNGTRSRLNGVNTNGLHAEPNHRWDQSSDNASE